MLSCLTLKREGPRAVPFRVRGFTRTRDLQFRIFMISSLLKYRPFVAGH